MAKIDASGWREFAIGELFDVYNGKKYVSHQRKPGMLAHIGNSAVNNGITDFIAERDDNVWSNFITVAYGSGTGVAFYHRDKAFVGETVMGLVPKFAMTESIGEFIAACLTQYGELTYTYDRKPKVDEYRNQVVIPLPATSLGDPDWDYMDEYMSGVMEEAKASLENMGKVEKELHSADISGWKRFAIGSLFEIEKGTRLTRAAMIDGDTPFIGATLENNGITARVGNTGHVHPGGLMTVAYNGQKATGKAFYQPIPFWASDDVNVLYPKFSLTENIALFLAPLFWEAGRPYSFGDKWGKDVMENDCLVLPVNASSDPDWAYMDEYMRDVMERAQSDLSTMQSIG